ncbi:MAG TPA: hypothetical protein P5229_01540 [Candidatus Gracilibacteria bacterium]|nr:hypothetical protein [Candidatus Gracilibacteria bacterium]
MRKTLLKYGVIITLLLQDIMVASAQVRPPIIPAGNTHLILPHSAGQTETAITGQLIPAVTRTVIAMAGMLAVLFIIYGGIQILTAYGKTEKIESAKKTITWAIAGLIISLLSYAIVSIVAGLQF